MLGVGAAVADQGLRVWVGGVWEDGVEKGVATVQSVCHEQLGLAVADQGLAWWFGASDELGTAGAQLKAMCVSVEVCWWCTGSRGPGPGVVVWVAA